MMSRKAFLTLVHLEARDAYLRAEHVMDGMSDDERYRLAAGIIKRFLNSELNPELEVESIAPVVGDAINGVMEIAILIEQLTAQRGQLRADTGEA